MMAMEWGRDNRARLRELTAKIATEQDHHKFTALVKEFNELLDSESQESHGPAGAGGQTTQGPIEGTAQEPKKPESK